MANQILYGFYDLASVFDLRVEEAGVEAVNTAVTATLEEHNRQLAAFSGLFVQPIEDYKLAYQTADAARLQPLDEFGRARPIQPAGRYEVAFPLQDAGIAWGSNFRARAKQRVGDVNRVLTTILGADIRWMRDHILAALYANETWTFPDPEHGDLVVKGLANGDSDPYLIQQGQDLPATDDHYLAQEDAISDANDPFEEIESELSEHPENSGPYVAFVPTDQKSNVQALTGFHTESDPNLRMGSEVTELVGSLGLTLPGTLLGYHDAGVWVAHWPILPAGRIPTIAVGGTRPVAMRQEPEASLRGFTNIAEREDYPYWEAQYVRIAGFGGWNRVGALVYQIGNADYSVPTNYNSPMA